MKDAVQRFAGAQRLGHFMLDEAKSRLRREVREIVCSACNVIVHADHAMSAGQQAVAEMRADKTRGAGNEKLHSPSSVAKRLRATVTG